MLQSAFLMRRTWSKCRRLTENQMWQREYSACWDELLHIYFISPLIVMSGRTSPGTAPEDGSHDRHSCYTSHKSTGSMSSFLCDPRCDLGVLQKVTCESGMEAAS